MLKPLQVGLSRPISYSLDPNAVFQPGMIAQMKKVGNEVVLGVSDGTAPFGIIDDVRDTAHIRPAIDEIVIIRAASIAHDGYDYVLGAEAMQTLENANIVDSSWVADYAGLTLNSVNGVVVAPAGTVLNYTLPDSATPNAIKVKVRYSYYVPNLPGDDSTGGSGKITAWFMRGIFQTDQYETTAPYEINSPLFVSPNGKLTTEQTLENQPAVAMCLVPPTALDSMLEFLWM